MALLTEPYYSNCHEVFRRSTNQSSLLLEEMKELYRDRSRVNILGVGSGVGLFEIPMLKMLQDAGVQISHFVGVDISAHACTQLEENLESEFGPGTWYDVVCSPFQDFTSSQSFDIVLFSHTFEYLRGRPVTWLRKSESLLSPGGQVIIFSPNRGGINFFYEKGVQELGGWSPFFADDIEAALQDLGTLFQKKLLVAECDVSLLNEGEPSPDKFKLLSFLSQRDCRGIPSDERRVYIDYYLSLREGGHTIPHPTTVFILTDRTVTDMAGSNK